MEFDACVDQEEEHFLTPQVTIEQLEQIVPRQDELDFVHFKRMGLIQRRVLRLLDPEMPEPHRNIEIRYLKHLGALTVLEHLPEV